MSIDATIECPCQSGATYAACCGPLHEAGGAGFGTSAEQLMRARYSAYVLHNGDFIIATWHPDTRPASVTFDDNLVWLGLDVIDAQDGTGFDTEGTVEFLASFRRGDEHLQLDETSRFVKLDGAWLYLDGS